MERSRRRRRMWAWALLLAACAGTPERTSTGRYEFDSASNSCRQRPELCARIAGEEAVVPPVRPIQAMVSATRTAAAAIRVLDSATQALIEERLKECADQARSSVLLEHRGGRAPTRSECNESHIDEASNRRMTLAMQLGCLMHRVALDCSETALEKIIPGGFSREQRYRYDKSRRTLAMVSEEEARGLLKSGCGSELKGTLVPDLVIHNGDPLSAHAIYDFKFPCTGTNMTPWHEYPAGHVYGGMTQKMIYREAFGAPASRVLPRWGVLP
ncbi:hypothetical protein HUA76_22640 [Myxococcus sp. CA056]|uniref:hypothetical protein n=1 Tax=Myxococcus sp. CA056 TaxID=2741740 RepID=UPI00157B8F41|nr:hypothetical protein [Myxococcus sp. CA056]NTX13610.1 hypothetical protein [Myxococcus sp. CA056]